MLVACKVKINCPTRNSRQPSEVSSNCVFFIMCADVAPQQHYDVKQSHSELVLPCLSLTFDRVPHHVVCTQMSRRNSMAMPDNPTPNLF